MTFHYALVGDLREKVLSSRRTKRLTFCSIVGRKYWKYSFQHQLKQLGIRSLGLREDDEFLSGWRRHEDLWAKIFGKLHVAGFGGKTGLQVLLKIVQRLPMFLRNR